MELKKNGDGQVVLSEDGFPVYVDKDGKEIIPNIPKLMDDLKSANKESAGRRKELEALKDELNSLKENWGDLSPEEAKKALDTLKNLDDKKLVDAGEVEKLKLSIKEGFEEQIRKLKKEGEAQVQTRVVELANKDKQIRQLLIEGAFTSSQFIVDKTVLTPDIAYRYFGDYFEVKEVEGKLRAVGMYHGDPILSRAQEAGEIINEQFITKIVFPLPVDSMGFEGIAAIRAEENDSPPRLPRREVGTSEAADHLANRGAVIL